MMSILDNMRPATEEEVARWAAQEVQRRAEQKAALIARYGSLEAVLKPTVAEDALPLPTTITEAKAELDCGANAPASCASQTMETSVPRILRPPV